MFKIPFYWQDILKDSGDDLKHPGAAPDGQEHLRTHLLFRPVQQSDLILSKD